jgi:acetyl-CoA carboxylase biotin carboxyl carrier protein
MSEPGTAPATSENTNDQHSAGGRHKKRHRQPSGQGKPRSQERNLNLEELSELAELISRHGFTEFELSRDDFRVRLRRDVFATPAHSAPPPVPVAAHPPQVAPVPIVSAPPHPGAAAEKAASADENLEIIKSPIVGTFYRSPSPTAEPFVKTGSRVTPDSVVCIIEAMKLMNEIQAETTGEIAKIYVENGTPVEFGQPLFGIKK